MWPHIRRSIVATAMIAALSSLSLAQEPPKTDPGKSRGARPIQNAPGEDPARLEPNPTPTTLDIVLPQLMSNLTEQISKLTTEVRLLRKASERNATTLEIMLSEDRLSRVESKLDDLMSTKSQLDAREQELLRRQRNIQQEMVLRAGTILRRDEAEAAVKADLQRALEDTRSQKEAIQQRINEVQNQADSIRHRIETLRKKVEPAETSSENKQP